MKLVPIVYVSDMARSLDYDRRLLPDAELVSSSPYWSEMSLGNASLALHIATEAGHGGRLGLVLTADGPLEEVVADLGRRGVSVDRDIADEAFGRSMAVTDPDGLTIQVNEHHRDLYTGTAG